jgi:hypothetical protein
MIHAFKFQVLKSDRHVGSLNQTLFPFFDARFLNIDMRSNIYYLETDVKYFERP